MKQFVRSVTIAGLLLAGPLAAQESESSRIAVTARFEPPTAAPGAGVELVLTVTPEAGWHVYGKNEEIGTPTVLSITGAGGLTIDGEARVPAGEKHTIGALTSWWMATAFDIKQRLKVPATAAPGEVEVKFKLDYMACTEEVCDQPAAVTGSATLKIVAATGKSPALAPPAAAAPTTFADNRLSVEAKFDPPRVTRNGTTMLRLRVTPALGWHVYGSKEETGKPIALTEVKGQGVTLVGTAQVPAGAAHAIGSITSYWLGEPFEIRQEVRVAKDANPGTVDVSLEIAYMACNDKLCEPATAIAGSVPLLVEAGEATAGDKNGAAGNSAGNSAGKPGAAVPASLLALLLAAVGAGLFALVMPCTYPMIPITISFFTKQAAARGRSAVGLSLLYGAGIVLMFVLIGLLVGAPIQRFAADPVFNLVVAAVFVAFGVSLLGLINLQPPQALMNFAGQASSRGGSLGVFLMGALLVITSFTCTAPVIGGLLGGSATLGGQLVSISTSQIALAMAVFGMTMALPFVALSLVPGKLKALPKSGEWMNTLKVFFGFVELAAALKFVSNTDIVWQWQALPRELFLWLWAALFCVAGLYLLGIIRLKGEDGGIGPGRLVSGLGTILFAVYCVFGALGNPLDFVMTAFAPNYSVTTAASGGSERGGKLAAKHLVIADDHDRALAVAKEKGKLLLINFTGFT